MSPFPRLAVLAVCLALASPGWGYAAGGGVLEEFRSDFERLLDDLAALGPKTRSLAPNVVQPDAAALDYARLKLAGADEAMLAQLKAATDLDPTIWSLPGHLEGSITLAQRSVRPAGTRSAADPQLCADDAGQEEICSSCPAGTPQGDHDVTITSGVIAGLEAVWRPIPDGNEIPIPIIGGSIRFPNIAKVILGIVLYATKTVELGLATANDYNDECENDYRDRLLNYNLDDTVSSRASKDAVAALLQSIRDFEAEALRLDIETNLVSDTGRRAVSQFQLPAAYGGHLEKVRAILIEGIEALQAHGEDVSVAIRYLTTGDEHFGAEQWVAAYEDYRVAYRNAVSARASRN